MIRGLVTLVHSCLFYKVFPRSRSNGVNPDFFTPGVKTPAYLAGVGVKNIGRGNYPAGVEVENNSEIIYHAGEVKKYFRGFFPAWVGV